jgi:non-ribosomal peptide synthase protein (TIGR01720 family)
VQELFLHQNVSALAQVSGPVEITPVVSEPEPGPVLFTPIQHWFFSQQHSRPEHFNQSVLLDLKRPVAPGVLAPAVSKLLAHHDALRMRFTFVDGQWQQHYGEQDATEVFTHTDFSDLSSVEAHRALEQKAEQLQCSLNLQSGPLLRVANFTMGDRTQRLLLIVHHLVMDGVSWRILLEDLESCCLQLMRGEAIELPAKTSSIQHWASALEKHRESDSFAEQTRYWLAQAGAAQPGKLLVDNERGENLHGSVAQEWIEFSAAETQTLLQDIPEQDGTQIQDVLVHAVLETLSEWSEQPEWIIELEGHGRDDEVAAVDVTRTVGWFTTIYPVRLRREADAEVESRLKQVREQLREVKDKGLAYGLLRYQAAHEEIRKLGSAEVIFNYLGQFDQVLGTAAGLFRIAAENAGPTQDERNKRPHLLEIVGVVSEGRLQVSWNYSAAVHRAETIESVARRFEAAVKEVIESRTGSFEADIEIDADLSHLELESILAKVGALQSS